jgi:hypothetical protein
MADKCSPLYVFAERSAMAQLEASRLKDVLFDLVWAIMFKKDIKKVLLAALRALNLSVSDFVLTEKEDRAELPRYDTFLKTSGERRLQT